ncbi:hypothetical protein UFOVP46_37 [uncultured Caudovirales phage]|uniref:Helix-turn-helix domain containing protein n=1 Tax=uncultured Caudovirales phage TaxID=2100421 RepID=A0A6J5KQG4_9CAUD|nr:hypothetical protein UFOVP46_37 [uncultured Caudovirales phage]
MDSEGLLLLSLNVTELRVLLALRHLADKNGLIKATMEDIGSLTKYGRESIRLAIRGLESANLLDTHRTKRNLGRLYKNEYQLLPVFLASDEKDPIILPEILPENLASTADISNTSNTDISIVINTSYLLESSAFEEEKFKEVVLVNNWKDDDDSIGGFGLLDGEVPASQKKAPVSKRNPKTRYQRPEEEWTAADVASEFSYRLYSKIKGVPAIINTDKLRGALAKWRKDYGTTAIIELEVMGMFFGDARVFDQARKEPHNAHRFFLRMLTTHSQQVTEKYEMDTEEPRREQYVFASDGKRFDNSMPGRASLDMYEDSLRRA